MLNVNPTNSSKIAKSVQRDYQQAAENHRLAKESGAQSDSNPLIKIGLILITLAAAVVTIGQFITL